MQALKIILIIILSLAFFIAILYLISIKLKKDKLEKIKNTEMSPLRNIHSLISLKVFPKNVMSGYYFPSAYSQNGSILKYDKIDTLVITGGGIAVITIKEHRGTIDNSDEKVWISSFGDNHIEFDNPLILGEKKRSMIYRLLKKERFSNIPVYSMIVFTDKNVEFTHQNDNVVQTAELIEMVDQFKSEKALSFKEMFEVRRLLISHRKTAKEAKEHLKRVYG